MTHFYIDKKILQSNVHVRILKVGHEKLAAIESEDSVVFGTEAFEEFSKVYAIDPPVFPPKRFQSAYTSLLTGIQTASQIPWKSCLPESVWKESLLEVAGKIREDYLDLNTDYWFKTYLPSNQIFRFLRPAKINCEYYNKIEDKKQIELSFEPDENGFAPVPRYSRSETITGRELTTEGPQILFLKREHREKLFESRFGEEGILLYADFSALEPMVLFHIGRILKNTTTEIPANDLYSWIKAEMKLEDFDRDTVKKLVLSDLYGIGYERLSDKLSLQEFYRLRDQLRHLFEIELIEKWISSTSNDQFISNWYGRRLPSNECASHKRLNHIIQSTAADVAHLAFSMLASEISNHSTDEVIFPLFTIHDALIFDCRKNSIETIKEAWEESVQGKIPGFKGKSFPLKIERL